MENKRLNLFMLAAAALMALTTVVHVFVGGPEVMDPLRASNTDPLANAVLHVVWHMVTLLLAVMTAALFHLTRQSNPALALVLVALNLGSALVFMVYGVALLGTLWPMPQWTVFGAMAGLIAMGMRRT